MIILPYAIANVATHQGRPCKEDAHGEQDTTTFGKHLGHDTNRPYKPPGRDDRHDHVPHDHVVKPRTLDRCKNLACHGPLPTIRTTIQAVDLKVRLQTGRMDARFACRIQTGRDEMARAIARGGMTETNGTCEHVGHVEEEKGMI